MNIQHFVYNENFYRKLALTVAIIRQTPANLTPREYAIELQKIVRRNKMNDMIKFEQLLSDVRSLRKSGSIHFPLKPLHLLEQYGNFLEQTFLISTDFTIEIQILVIETIERTFQLIQENFLKITQSKFETLFKQLIHAILNFDMIPNIQKHSIQHIQQFIHLTLTHIKQQSKVSVHAQTLIEQLGRYSSYFLVVLKQILVELFTYFDKTMSNSTYALTLIHILEHLIASHTDTTLKQVLSNESILQQFHALLYICLVYNNKNNSLVIDIWNLYGRIL